MITLGINYNKTHDSAACIVRNGEVCSRLPKRLSRIKHDAAFRECPFKPVSICEHPAEQLDEVCLVDHRGTWISA